MFRQSRFGWHILAVGGNRKAARHGGISVKLTVFFAYVIAGMIVGLSAFLFAARQDSIGADTGIGMEFFTLTALVVGLGGFVPGRGSVVSVLMGFATVYILGDVLINSGFRGDSTQFVLGLIIIVILGDRREIPQEPAPPAGVDVSRSGRLRDGRRARHGRSDAGRRRAQAVGRRADRHGQDRRP